MCGIAGYSCFTKDNGIDIQKMTQSLNHRGPDESSFYRDDYAALGHCRLSILDLEHGKQPMRDPQSGLIIIYNGEIYNHQEIRRELENLGHYFQTRHSDTETCLHAFAEWGVDAFLRFNGMFALAIYSPSQKKIWLARDRFGEKPLFYVLNDNGFAFVSELTALKGWSGFNPEYDPANIQRFFAWNYLPGNKTVYKDCKSLQQGSWGVYNIVTREFHTEQYWRFELKPDTSLNDESEPDLVEELQRLLTQAVKRRLLSDVPLGLFLSGGIDSSAILACAARVMDIDQINTFTIGFNETSYDESSKARLVADYFGVKNHVKILTEQVMQGSINSILTNLSEPFGDASLIPSYHLSKFARESVKVALTGDGGDELFGGYDPMAAINPAVFYRRLIPAGFHNLLRIIFNKIPASDKNMSLEFKIKRALKGLSWAEDYQLPVWMSGLDPAQIKEFFNNPLNAQELFEEAIKLYELHPQANALEKALLFFTCLYLPDDILVKSDRASMMVSLEARAVFLDNDLVAFCEKLPMRFKYRCGKRKYLLKKALEKMLPKQILEQPKKGFGIPLNKWLRCLPEPKIQIPDLKEGTIDYCYNLHKKRKGDFRYFLWDLQSYAALQKCTP